jgi:hypothetical protein
MSLYYVGTVMFCKNGKINLHLQKYKKTLFMIEDENLAKKE